MGQRAPKDLAPRPHSMRTRTPSIMKASDSTTTRSKAPLRHNNNKSNVQIPEIEVLEIELEQDESAPISKKKGPPEPTLATYLVNAQAYLGIQRVHVETKQTVEGFWSCRQFFLKAEEAVQKLANLRAIEFNMLTSIAVITHKGMKRADIMETLVPDYHAWNDVESVVNHLASSKSKGIRVDLTLKFIAVNVDNGVNTDEEDLDDGVVVQLAKRGRKVNLSILRH